MVVSGCSMEEETVTGRLGVESLNTNCIQPTSSYIHIGKKLLVLNTCRYHFYVAVGKDMYDLAECVDIGGD